MHKSMSLTYEPRAWLAGWAPRSLVLPVRPPFIPTTSLSHLDLPSGHHGLLEMSWWHRRGSLLSGHVQAGASGSWTPACCCFCPYRRLPHGV